LFFVPTEREKAMASFVKLKLSELVVNQKGQLVCLQEEGNFNYGDIDNFDLNENEFCFNMLAEVEEVGICFGFSPKFVNSRLGW
jgi:hypothetical protein